MARRRIACRMARRRIACLWPVARSCAVWPVARSRIVTSLPMSATCMSLRYSRFGEPNARRLPCLGPTWRCSRRRQRRFTNVYSFVMPWRFIMARSAARLSAIVGPLSRHGSCRTGEPHGTSAIHGAEESGQPDITGHNRT